MYRFSNPGVLLRDADTADDLESGRARADRQDGAINDVAARRSSTRRPSTTPRHENVDEDYYYDRQRPRDRCTIDLVPGDGTRRRRHQVRSTSRCSTTTTSRRSPCPQDQWATPAGTELTLFTPDADSSNPPTTPDPLGRRRGQRRGDRRGAGRSTPPVARHDPDDGEGDEFLVVMWATCGTFSLVSTNDWDIGDDIEHVIDFAYGRVTRTAEADPAGKHQFVDALTNVLPDEVKNFPFIVPFDDPAQTPVTGFAGVVNDIQALNYSLGRVTFHAVGRERGAAGGQHVQVAGADLRPRQQRVAAALLRRSAHGDRGPDVRVRLRHELRADRRGADDPGRRRLEHRRDLAACGQRGRGLGGAPPGDDLAGGPSAVPVHRVDRDRRAARSPARTTRRTRPKP